MKTHTIQDFEKEQLIIDSTNISEDTHILEVLNCEILKKITINHQNITSFTIKQCPKINNIKNLENLENLQEINIEDCPKLTGSTYKFKKTLDALREKGCKVNTPEKNKYEIIKKNSKEKTGGLKGLREKLKQYLEDNKIKQVDFAIQCKIQRPTFNRFYKDGSMVRLTDIMMIIEVLKINGVQITAEDYLPLGHCEILYKISDDIKKQKEEYIKELEDEIKEAKKTLDF